MRSVADFYQDCQAVAHAVPPLDVKLADAVSCVLAEDVQAPFNLPVADLSACDGYAVRVRDCEGATLETPVTLPVTEEIRAHISTGRSVQDIVRAARKVGYQTLRYDGLKKVLLGLTTIEQIEENSSFEWET